MSYHPGELAVQKRVGVREQADELTGMYRSALTPPVASILAQHRFAVLSSQDAEGNVWASPLAGPPGIFAVADEHNLRILSDRLDLALIHGEHAGLLVIDFNQRLRIRINGEISRVDGALNLRLSQLYGNCTKYIQRRVVAQNSDSRVPHVSPTLAYVGVFPSLTEHHAALIARSDTFFIATHHRDSGADASHRGGRPGFVTAPDPHTIVWPDYRGNNMFNTLGNLELDSRAGLLFIDFESGSALQVTGTANADFGDPSSSTPTGRSIRFAVSAVRELPPSESLRYSLIEPFPYNPPVGF